MRVRNSTVFCFPYRHGRYLLHRMPIKCAPAGTAAEFVGLRCPCQRAVPAVSVAVRVAVTPTHLLSKCQVTFLGSPSAEYVRLRGPCTSPVLVGRLLESAAEKRHTSESQTGCRRDPSVSARKVVRGAGVTMAARCETDVGFQGSRGDQTT